MDCGAADPPVVGKLENARLPLVDHLAARALRRRASPDEPRPASAIGAARASLISTVEPTSTITLASLLLDESLTRTQVLGGTLVICGVVLAKLGGPGRPETRPPE